MYLSICLAHGDPIEVNDWNSFADSIQSFESSFVLSHNNIVKGLLNVFNNKEKFCLEFMIKIWVHNSTVYKPLSRRNHHWARIVSSYFRIDTLGWQFFSATFPFGYLCFFCFFRGIEFNFAFNICKKDDHWLVDSNFFIFFNEIIIFIEFCSIFTSNISQSNWTLSNKKSSMFLRDWYFFEDKGSFSIWSSNHIAAIVKRYFSLEGLGL